MKKEAIDAMEALFAFCEAMDGLSIDDLTEVIKLAVADGHEQMILRLVMAQIALKQAK